MSAPDVRDPDRTLRYADHADGIVDVHLPREGVGPLLLLIHGGFWKTAYDRVHTRPLARALADRGFVVASPEYRRVGPGGTGGWPQTGEDVRRALEVALRATGSATPTVTGHSAGGHLALWLATTDAPASRVVALAPVCDLREAIRRRLGSDATRAFLGPIGVDVADPMVLLGGLPHHRRPVITVVHGSADEEVPIALSRGLVEAHPWIRLVELAGTDHFAPIDPRTGACRRYLDEVSRTAGSAE